MHRNRRQKKPLGITKEDKYKIKKRKAYRRRIEGIAAIAIIVLAILVIGITFITVM